MAIQSLLSPAERVALLRLARGSLERVLAGGDLPEPEGVGVEITPALARPGAAFVTLRRRGDLRGCIGEIHASRPLWQSVQAMAVGAALRDIRFRRVTEEEIADLRIHVSVLTEPEPVAGWNDIVVGRHGIVLQKDGRSATFLPQVATEQGWDVEQTLTHLARKAGLSPDAWRHGATFLVFEAFAFGE